MRIASPPEPQIVQTRISPGRAPWGRKLVIFAAACVVALLVHQFAPGWLKGIARALAAYDAGALVMLALFWRLSMHVDPQATERRAQLDDPGRNIVLTVVLVTVAAGLLAAVAILGRTPNVASLSEKLFTYGLAIVAVAVGWALIHTVFTFRYAHLFYYSDDDDNEADRGLIFPGTPNPSDYDFAYFSFVVGMTFQVSDVQVTDRGVRRLVLFHGLISFAYNTMIFALVINIVSGLIHS